MQHLQELLDKYKAGTATDPERDELLTLLSNHDDDLRDALEKEFDKKMPGREVILSDSRSAAVLRQLHEKIVPTIGAERPQSPSLVKYLGWASLAAAVLAGIAVSVHFFSPQPVAAGRLLNTIAPATAAAPAAMSGIVNNGTSIKNILLEDGSAVALYPHSAITYKKPFDIASRAITLRGQALFKVAKDPSRLFTVTANSITTTALGTTFSVLAHSGDNKIRVRLLEGRVMIRSDNRKDIFLTPGQECLVNRTGGDALVKSFSRPKAAGALAGRSRQKDSQALEFSKERLTVVFAKIARHFNITIRCSDKDVNSLSFTGKFLPSDSLEVMLNVICNTNDLLFQNQDSLITIRKLR